MAFIKKNLDKKEQGAPKVASGIKDMNMGGGEIMQSGGNDPQAQIKALSAAGESMAANNYTDPTPQEPFQDLKDNLGIGKTPQPPLNGRDTNPGVPGDPKDFLKDPFTDPIDFEGDIYKNPKPTVPLKPTPRGGPAIEPVGPKPALTFPKDNLVNRTPINDEQKAEMMRQFDIMDTIDKSRDSGYRDLQEWKDSPIYKQREIRSNYFRQKALEAGVSPEDYDAWIKRQEEMDKLVVRKPAAFGDTAQGPTSDDLFGIINNRR